MMRSDVDTRRSGAGIFSRLSAVPVPRTLMLTLLCGLIYLACLVLSSPAGAQNRPGSDGQKDKNPYIWDDKDTPAPKGPKPVRRAPAPPKRLPLTLRWQLFTLDRQNLEVPASPSREFSDGDSVRLAVQVNQDGYLYLVKNTVEKDGKITPPTLVSKDVGSVTKNSVTQVPFGCDQKSARNGKCWWKLRKPAGREVITAIFSRTEIREIADAIRLSQGEETYISDSLLFRITQQSPEPRHQGWSVEDQNRHPVEGLKGTYVTMVWNPAPQVNEVLVERIEFTHK